MNEKGEPDVAPELWSNSLRAPLDAAKEEGRLISTGNVFHKAVKRAGSYQKQHSENPEKKLGKTLSQDRFFPNPKPLKRVH
ncbi:MAG: hypothetical protein CM15mP73_0780 [Hyphomicrobiales bacterium]|nr:MAG: hypothetical protein CM15mP73_0780 [Hyphomicrobiales bacterium]